MLKVVMNSTLYKVFNFEYDCIHHFWYRNYRKGDIAFPISKVNLGQPSLVECHQGANIQMYNRFQLFFANFLFYLTFFKNVSNIVSVHVHVQFNAIM